MRTDTAGRSRVVINGESGCEPPVVRILTGFFPKVLVRGQRTKDKGIRDKDKAKRDLF